MTCSGWIQRKWHREYDHKTCSFIQALFLTGLNTAMKCGFTMQSIYKPNWRILFHTMFLPWVHIMLWMYFPVVFSSFPNLCKIHLVTHVLFYEQNLREVTFFFSSERSISLQLWMSCKDQTRRQIFVFWPISFWENP